MSIPKSFSQNASQYLPAPDASWIGTSHEVVKWSVVSSMGKKKTGWPFLEGFLSDGVQDIHLFTDYR